MALTQLAVEIRGGAGGSRDGFSGDAPLFAQESKVFEMDRFHAWADGSGEEA